MTLLQLPSSLGSTWSWAVVIWQLEWVGKGCLKERGDGVSEDRPPQEDQGGLQVVLSPQNSPLCPAMTMMTMRTQAWRRGLGARPQNPPGPRARQESPDARDKGQQVPQSTVMSWGAWGQGDVMTGS